MHKPKRTKTARHKRLPNGFGQITRVTGKNLRKPYRATITVGKTEFGKPIQRALKPVSYFETYNDAYQALLNNKNNPYEIKKDISVEELYAKWSEKYFETLTSQSSIRTVTSAWNHSKPVHSMKTKDLRARHIKGLMDDAPSANVASRIKSMFNLMLDYAVEYEIVDKNYARTFDISSEIIDETKEAKKSHIDFTDDEITKLWENINLSAVDIVLIQCYTGFRPQELGLIRLENVNLDEDWIIGGMKTDAGTNRIVPIHSRIKPLIQKRYDEAVAVDSEYLLNCLDGTTHKSSTLFTYDKYRHRFNKIVEDLSLNSEHRAHDGRVQFITMAKKYQVNEFAIKYIVGHAVNDITEKVYTKRDISWLKSEIEKIK